MSSISRRELLVLAASTAAAATLPRSLVQADPLGLPIGVQLYTVAAELRKDFDGTLHKLAEIGFRIVENATFSASMNSTQLRAALDKVGMSCQSVHYGLTQLQGNLPKIIDEMHVLGAKYAVCPTPWVADPSRLAAAMKGNSPEVGFGKFLNSMTLDDWRWNAEHFNKIGEAMKKAGLQFAYHNHSFEFRVVDGKIIFDELLALTDPDLVKIELDCGWVANAGHNPAGYIDRFPDRIQLLHVKDIQKRQVNEFSFDIQGIHMGGGIVDWPAVFAAAKRAGVKGYFVEQENPFPAPVFEELKASYDYLHKLS